MPTNFIYFIIAYVLIFICLGLYVISLCLKTRKIKQEKNP